MAFPFITAEQRLAEKRRSSGVILGPAGVGKTTRPDKNIGRIIEPKNPMRNAKYLLSLFPGIVTLLGNAAGGWWVCSNIIFSLVVLAIAESFTGENTDNNFEESSSLPDMILYAHVVLQTLCMSTLFYAIKFYQLSNVQILLAALSTGIHSGSSAIIIAHELIHRKEKHFQYLGKFLLLTSGNIYFYVNHLRVHHKWVGTMRDPATSRLGENVYKFFIRSASQQIVSSYNCIGQP